MAKIEGYLLVGELLSYYTLREFNFPDKTDLSCIYYKVFSLNF